MQKSDELCEAIVIYLKTKQLPIDKARANAVMKYAQHSILDSNDVLWYNNAKDGFAPALFVPKCLVNDYLLAAHRSELTGGHAGIPATRNRLLSMCFWPT